ncbi:unnamed protein product [Staurois parvus]|uniref:Uncharacterized protein n=1 Tax=Staurois parvus TaxID=386267 RepID=A0ABN9CQD4_9NEOB|nr:unnamed protein product [Staurois parvus]
MTKWETTSSVRRPESGTWQSVAMESSNGRPYRAHDTLWTWQQHEEAVQGPMARLRAWQQREESVRGPMAAYYGPGSSMRRRYRGPWRRVAVEAAVFGSHTQA